MIVKAKTLIYMYLAFTYTCKETCSRAKLKSCHVLLDAPRMAGPEIPLKTTIHVLQKKFNSSQFSLFHDQVHRCTYRMSNTNLQHPPNPYVWRPRFPSIDLRLAFGHVHCGSATSPSHCQRGLPGQAQSFSLQMSPQKRTEIHLWHLGDVAVNWGWREHRERGDRERERVNISNYIYKSICYTVIHKYVWVRYMSQLSHFIPEIVYICQALLDCLVVGAGPVGLLLASELPLVDTLRKKNGFGSFWVTQVFFFCDFWWVILLYFVHFGEFFLSLCLSLGCSYIKKEDLERFFSGGPSPQGLHEGARHGVKSSFVGSGLVSHRGVSSIYEARLTQS